MALTAFTGTISATVLKDNFDDKTSTLSSNAARAGGDWYVTVNAPGLSTTSLFVDFTAPDDCELRYWRVTAQHTAAGQTVTATITVTDGDTDYLLGQTFSLARSTTNGTNHTTNDYTDVTSTRLRLLKGVTYRLAIVATAAVTWGQTTIILRNNWRTA